MMYWGRALQQFVYMLTELCSTRRMYDLLPDAHSAHPVLAAISRLLQSTELSGNAQLTWDDAIYYEHGMRIGCLTFNQEGHRHLPDATLAEREHMRRYNWLVREGRTSTVKSDLAAVWNQIGRWPVNRVMEQTIPQVRFAQNTEIIKLLVGSATYRGPKRRGPRKGGASLRAYLRLMVSHPICNCDITSGSSCAVGILPSLRWNLDVIADDFKLNQAQVKKSTEKLETMTVNEVLALALGSGPIKFVAGPLVDLVAAGNLIKFYTYAGSSKMSGLIGLGELFSCRINRIIRKPFQTLRVLTALAVLFPSICVWPVCGRRPSAGVAQCRRSIAQSKSMFSVASAVSRCDLR